MKYREMTADDLKPVAKKYLEYYNGQEDGCWTFEKAYKRIHQVLTIEDAYCMLQYDDGGELVGFLMGYYKQFDDLKAYFLEEIVIFSGKQNSGYGTAFLQELERLILQNGASHIELISVNDERHMHFYKKLGFYAAANLSMMGKHFDV